MKIFFPLFILVSLSCKTHSPDNPEQSILHSAESLDDAQPVPPSEESLLRYVESWDLDPEIESKWQKALVYYAQNAYRTKKGTDPYVVYSDPADVFIQILASYSSYGVLNKLKAPEEIDSDQKLADFYARQDWARYQGKKIKIDFVKRRDLNQYVLTPKMLPSYVQEGISKIVAFTPASSKVSKFRESLLVAFRTTEGEEVV